MGISINVSAKQDYSSLFNSLPSRSGGSSVANLNFLSDYASIKNGSYGKLMKAYYGRDSAGTSTNSSGNTSISTAKDSSQTLSNVEGAAESLKSSADKLLATGSKSLFTEKDITTKDENGVSTTAKGYDTDAIYKAVSTFVDDYNNMLSKGASSNSSSITGKIDTLTNASKANKNMLSKVGITIGENGKLSVDEETFKKADMSTVKNLFNGTGSYGYQVSAQASWLDFAATNEASKSNTYSASGTYSNNYSAGDILSSYF